MTTRRCRAWPGSVEPDREAQLRSSQRQHGFDGSFEFACLLRGDTGGFAVNSVTEVQGPATFGFRVEPPFEVSARVAVHRQRHPRHGFLRRCPRVLEF